MLWNLDAPRDRPEGDPGPRAIPAGQSMRIVMVANQFPKFSETFIVRKFMQLAEKGWDVHLVCRSSDPAQWSNFPELRNRVELGARIHVTQRLPEVLELLRPHLVHFEFGTLALKQIEAARRIGAKIVVSFRGSDLSTFGLEEPDGYREVWEGADALHLLSQDLWRLAIRRGCPPEKPHVLIPPAVRLRAWRQARRSTAESVGGPDRPLRIVSVGRLTWIKGYGHALGAVRRLIDRGVHCEYRIIGDGPERAGVVFDVHDMGLQERVTLLGVLPPAEVRENLLWADVFLHSALYEGFCNSVLEAQSMGLPVVCSDGGALPENVVNGVTGFVVPRRDPAALAEKLEALSRSGRLRRTMGTMARRRVQRSFRDEAQITRFEELYRDLIGKDLLSARPAGRENGFDGATVEAVQPPQENAPTCDALLDAFDPTLERIREAAAAVLPHAARVLVVSRGDQALLELEGLRTGHFPQTEDGTYLGYHPASSEEAIRSLETLRIRGIEYILFPSTAFWWLEHYRRLREHLDARYRLVFSGRDSCMIYSLASTRETAGSEGSAIGRTTGGNAQSLGRADLALRT